MRRVGDDEDRANDIASRGLLAVKTMSVQRDWHYCSMDMEGEKRLTANRLPRNAKVGAKAG